MSAAQRAESLLRWYPASWRDRYGAEFTELLIADLQDRPRCWRRDADLMCSGVRARIAGVGLCRGAMCRPQSALAVLCCALVGFLACAVSLWSQLVVGSRWSAGGGRAVTTSIPTMSIGLAVLVLAVGLAAAPLVFSVAREIRRGSAQRFLVPTVVLGLGIAALIVGAHLLGAGWPGAGGHQGRFARFTPVGVARLGWAETVPITAYWAHPHALLALPRAELLWTLASPVLLATSLVAAAKLVRRVTLSPASLAYESRLARFASLVMLPCLGSAAWWVAGSRHGSAEVFRAGTLDVVLIAAMAVSLWTVRATASQLNDTHSGWRATG